MAISGECGACDYEREHGIKIDDSKKKTEWERETGISRFTLKRHFEHGDVEPPTDRVTNESSTDGKMSTEFIRDRPITLEDAEEWVRKAGKDPDDYVISARSIAYGGDKSSNRMSAYPKPGRKVSESALLDLDPVGILSQLRSQRTTAPGAVATVGEESAFGISINDIQLGQSYNGGSAATIEQFYRYVDLAVERVLELRSIGRRLETLVIVGGGDLVEGCVIYPNQSFSLDLNRKQQIEGVVALLLHAIDTLAPMFERVIVLAAAGNHGQNRINGNYTTLDDNDDTHAFEMAKLALSRDSSMNHIQWIIAESEAGVAARVYDWVLATTHGDIYAKGVPGATIDKKAHAWMKNMALGRGKFGLLGQADILITHHFHHEKGSDWGSCLWRQTPSQDRGSPYFENATGEYSEPGMLSWVTTPGERWKDEQVLRWSAPAAIAA